MALEVVGVVGLEPECALRLLAGLPQHGQGVLARGVRAERPARRIVQRPGVRLHVVAFPRVGGDGTAQLSVGSVGEGLGRGCVLLLGRAGPVPVDQHVTIGVVGPVRAGRQPPEHDDEQRDESAGEPHPGVDGLALAAAAATALPAAGGARQRRTRRLCPRAVGLLSLFDDVPRAVANADEPRR